MSKYPIPHAALDDRLAWTGNSGSGKTHDAGTAIEKVLHAKSRACIVDPLGVWWGLRLNADGKSAGFKVAIFGGPHGDIAITETSGKLIGETAAGTKESCIIDLSEFESDASQRRFMLAFLVALYNSLKGDLLHLVLDEADMWAPQRIMDKEGDATKLHHNVQKIVRRGRVKGFISWLITQRPAEISKSILSMMDGLAMHQAVSPQDISAVMDWVRPRADKITAEMIETQLPTFEVGKSVVYIPRRRILNIAQFPKKMTFDSSAAPERGKKKNRPDVTLKPLDIEVLKKRLEKVEAEAKANDPNALKAEIAALKKAKAALEATTPKPAAPKAAIAAELTAKQEKAIERAATVAKVAGYVEAMSAAGNHFAGTLLEPIPALTEALSPLKVGEAALKPLKLAINEHAQWLTAESQRKKPALVPVTRDDVKTAIQQSGSPAGASAVAPRRAAGGPTTARANPSPAASGDGTISRVQQSILDAVAEMETLCRKPPPRTLVAIMAGYKNVKSTGFAKALSNLSAIGHVAYPDSGTVATTESGGALANPPQAATTSAEVQDRVIRIMGQTAGKILSELIAEYPNDLDRQELAQRSGYENVKSTGFAKSLSRLSALGFVTYPSARQARAGEILFP